MATRLFVRLALFSALVAAGPLWAQVGPGGVVGGVGPGGVVGGTRPATRPSATAPRSGVVGTPAPAVVAPAVPIVLPKTFAAQPPDPVERAEFMNKAKPIAKNITSATAMMVIDDPDTGEIGVTADVIATVAAGSRQGTAFSAVMVKKQAAIGPEMQTSFDEAVRAVGMRYPRIEPGRIEFSFGDKYTPHEGGSAGTCFAVMLLSEIEGFEIDSKCAVTGDITVDWKVRKIGGLAAKVRGAAADKCLFTGVPAENRDQLNDMALFYGDAPLRDIQVFTLETLQDAVALLRKDRSPQMVEAMKEFTDLGPKIRGGRGLYSLPANQQVLENIVALAPNHASAKMMLEMAKGTFPRTLTLGFAFDQLGVAIDPYADIIGGREPVTRKTVTAGMTAAARKQLTLLLPISPPELQPIVKDMQSIVDASESIALGQANPSILDVRRNAFKIHLDALGNNKDFIEKLYRGGM